MIPSENVEQFSRAPPVNVLYNPRKPPPPDWPARASASLIARGITPGSGMAAPIRQIASNASVKRIRLRSSGILKQFAKAAIMDGPYDLGLASPVAALGGVS